MKFDREKHHRRSIRLKGYDYSQPGGYFVTFVTQGRELLFGRVRRDEVVLTSAGNMIVKWWKELQNKFPSVSLGTFVVMPNHFHGIVCINEPVGADLRVCLDVENEQQGEHIDSPLRNRPNTSLFQIVQWFKTMTTNEYIRGVKQLEWIPFNSKLWQRNYYEHILRDQDDWCRIHSYIESNPVTWANDDENIVKSQ